MLWSWPPSSEGFGEESSRVEMSSRVELGISLAAPPLANASLGLGREKFTRAC